MTPDMRRLVGLIMKAITRVAARLNAATAPKISVQDIVSLDNVRIDMPSVISIRVWLGRNGGTDRAQALEELFKTKPGNTQVRLRLESPRDFSVLLDVDAKVRPDKEFKAKLEEICGPECLERVAG